MNAMEHETAFERRAQAAHEDGIHPALVGVMRDVHHIDTRVALLEQSSATTAATLVDIKRGQETANATMSQVRDQVVGWRGSLAIIVSIGAVLIPLMLWMLNRLVAAAPGGGAP
jgi:hypothetical protein